MKILNAFSIQMLPGNCSVSFTEVSAPLAGHLMLSQGGVESAIGHEDTARVVSNILHLDVPYNRVNVVLNVNEQAIVAQLSGGRLPEGTTELPEGFTIKFYLIAVHQ